MSKLKVAYMTSDLAKALDLAGLKFTRATDIHLSGGDGVSPLTLKAEFILDHDFMPELGKAILSLERQADTACKDCEAEAPKPATIVVQDHKAPPQVQYVYPRSVFVKVADALGMDITLRTVKQITVAYEGGKCNVTLCGY